MLLFSRNFNMRRARVVCGGFTSRTLQSRSTAAVHGLHYPDCGARDPGLGNIEKARVHAPFFGRWAWHHACSLSAATALIQNCETAVLTGRSGRKCLYF